VFTYVSLALVAAALVFIAVNVIRGLVRGLQKSVGSLVAVILASVSAVLTASALCQPYSVISLKICDLLHTLLEGSAAAEIFAISEVDGAVSAYASMIIAPIMFLVAFILFSVIFGIICGIVMKKIPQWVEKKSGASRFGGLGVGLVVGALVAVLVLTPAVGTLNAVVSSGIDESLPEETAQLIAEGKNDSTLQTLSNLGCGALYDTLASVKLNGEKIYLKNEIESLAIVASQLSALKGDIAEFDAQQIAALKTAIGGMDKSPILKSAVAGVLSEAAGKWTEGETFVGAEKPQMSTMLAPVMDELLEVLKTSDSTNVVSDLNTVADVFGILCESGMLKTDGDLTKVLAGMGENKVVEKLLVTVTANKRMTGLADEVTAMSIKAVASAFDMPANAQENYSSLMNEVAAAVVESSEQTVEERKEVLAGKMEKVMTDHGVKVDVEAAKNISESLVDDLGKMENPDSEAIEEFFLIYAIAAQDLEIFNDLTAKAMKATAGYQVSFLGTYQKTAKTQQVDKKDKDKKYDVTFDDEGNIFVNGRKLKNYKASDYKNSAAYKSGAQGKNFGGGATLSSAETMESTKVTVEDVVSSMGSYAECEDTVAEANAIQTLVENAVANFIGNKDEDKKDSITDLISGAGALLDGVSETVSVGQQAASQLLTGILQSNKVTETLGVSVENATKVAETINEKAKSENFNYSQATTAISNTLNVLEGAKNEEKTREEQIEATKGMIENITPESAEIMGALTTPDMIKNYGIPETNAEAVSSAVGSMFENMGNYDVKEKDDAEQFEKEAEAVDKMFQLVLNSYNAGAANLFETNGEKGKITASASELVALSVESEVISKTVDDVIYGDGTYKGNPLNIPTLTDSDVQQIEDAINSYYYANGQTPELARKLKGIAGFLNVDIDF